MVVREAVHQCFVLPIARVTVPESVLVVLPTGIAHDERGGLGCLGHASPSPAFRLDPPELAGRHHRRHVAAADVDLDGDYELVVGENSGDTLFFDNTGTASSPA